MEYLIHRLGQGASNLPVIWLFISLTLFKVKQKHANRARFVIPQDKEKVKTYMVGFIDDTNGS